MGEEQQRLNRSPVPVPGVCCLWLVFFLILGRVSWFTDEART